MSSAPFELAESTSSSLIARVRARDGEAWQRFARLYGPLVYSWVRRAKLQEADIADVMQEVFRGVAIGIDSFRTGPQSSFRAWLWGITRNKLTDFYRQRASQPMPHGGTDVQEQVRLTEIPLDELSAAGSQCDLLHRALKMIRGDFDDRTWDAFWRMAVGNASATEISTDLAMTPRAVRQAKYRVLRRLRSELDGMLN